MGNPGDSRQRSEDSTLGACSGGEGAVPVTVVGQLTEIPPSFNTLRIGWVGSHKMDPFLSIFTYI